MRFGLFVLFDKIKLKNGFSFLVNKENKQCYTQYFNTYHGHIIYGLKPIIENGKIKIWKGN